MTTPDKDPPPHNEPMELMLLGTIFADAEVMPAIAPIVRPFDFYIAKHRHLYDAAFTIHMRGDIVDVLLLKCEIDRRGLLEEVGGIDYLATVATAAATGGNATAYAKEIRDLALKREVLRLAYEMGAEARNGHAGAETAHQYAQALAEMRDLHTDKVPNPFEVVRMTETDETPWLVRGYLARRAVTLLSAHPKAGKTTMAYAIVGALQRGDKEWCGLALPETCETLVLTEEPDAIIGETFRSVGVDSSRVKALTRDRAFPRRALAQDIDFAIETIKADPSIGLVILDTWAFWANLREKGGNDRDTVLRAYQEIMRLASVGVAVLVIHHARKSDGEEGNMASGSNALTGAADVLLELRRFGKGEGSTLRAITAYGRFQRIPAEKIVDFQGGRYADMGEADQARHRMKETKVLTHLTAANRWLTIEEVADAVGLKLTPTQDTLRALHAKREVQRAGKGGKGSPFLFAALSVPLHAQPPTV